MQDWYGACSNNTLEVRGVMNMRGKIFFYLAFIIELLIAEMALADRYESRQDFYEYRDRGYSDRTYSNHSSSNAVGYGSDHYYACPNGDYISDRPGQCPLDGQSLVPRRCSSGRERSPYTDPYSY